tara:strand:- start:7279 stop:7500 length:222 start_codon:yes stop_codon:yes gene_type:complete
MTVKLMIEVSGGVVTNIVATEEVSINIVDHDNLGDNQHLVDGINEVKQAQQPDRICDEDEYQEQLNETLKEYA